MPADGSYYNLGKNPKQKNIMPTEETMMYPTMHIEPKQYPPLKEMKLGGTGEAKIKFKISKYGGIDVIAIAPLTGGKKYGD